MNKNITVITLGGSIVVPDRIDTVFLKKMKKLLTDYINGDPGRRVILVIGGGGTARTYQKAYREMEPLHDKDELDWIGIAATILNARFLKAVFYDLCKDNVVTNPEEKISFTGKILIAAGWKPGFSTDFDAVMLAKQFKADTLLNLSNISWVYTDDPEKNPSAEPIESISWSDFRKLVGDVWIPGKNVPFDPIAAKLASKMGLRVITANGRDLDNLNSILAGEPFKGTTIGSC